MKNQVYIRDLSRKQLAVLLEECFYIIGKSTSSLDSFHVETMINGVLKFNSNMWIDNFKGAFEQVGAGELDADIYGSPSPAIIGKILKAYRNKDGINVKSKKIENITPHGLPPATDEDYYNSLICVMEGKVSDRRKMAFPDAQPTKGNEIPMFWDWEAVYRHLRVLNQVDELANPKSEVIKWIYIKYPNAILQSHKFKSSRTFGTSLGQRVKQSLGV